MSERKSIIPKWADQHAGWVMDNFDFHPDALHGAIAAALHSERERCAKLIERYQGEIPLRQELAHHIRRGSKLKADGSLIVGDA